jgi:hypothetical protein
MIASGEVEFAAEPRLISLVLLVHLLLGGSVCGSTLPKPTRSKQPTAKY